MKLHTIERLLRLARRQVFNPSDAKSEQAGRMIPRLKERLFSTPEHLAHLDEMESQASERLLRMWS